MIGRRKKQETERMAEPAEAQKLPFGYEAYTWLHDVVSCLAFVMILFVFFPVSYTHLDVYKRQIFTILIY